MVFVMLIIAMPFILLEEIIKIFIFAPLMIIGAIIYGLLTWNIKNFQNVIHWIVKILEEGEFNFDIQT